MGSKGCYVINQYPTEKKKKILMDKSLVRSTNKIIFLFLVSAPK